MLGVVGWPSKHVTLTDSVSVKRFVQKLSTLKIKIKNLDLECSTAINLLNLFYSSHAFSSGISHSLTLIVCVLPIFTTK